MNDIAKILGVDLPPDVAKGRAPPRPRVLREWKVLGPNVSLSLGYLKVVDYADPSDQDLPDDTTIDQVYLKEIKSLPAEKFKSLVLSLIHEADAPIADFVEVVGPPLNAAELAAWDKAYASQYDDEGMPICINCDDRLNPDLLVTSSDGHYYCPFCGPDHEPVYLEDLFGDFEQYVEHADCGPDEEHFF